MGHPTHAFDLDKLEGGIIVRLAHKGEKLKLLDGTDRILEPDDLVVADHNKALALAGVMGGWGSMITPETKNILVEAAWFDPVAIRRSSRRHGLHTDASHRFERGADINAAPIANALVSSLILQAGGHPEGALIDVVIPEIAARTANRPPIQLSVKQVQRHLGTTLDDTPHHSALTPDLIHQYLTALGCTLKPAEDARVPHPSRSHREGWDVQSPDHPDTTFSVQLPSWRLDLEREIDLIEEVARVYGYNRFANTLPTALPVIAHPTAAKEAAVRTRLLALGYSESISSTFASQTDADLFAGKGKRTVPMENPLSEEASLLRPSLVPGMLNMLAHNLNRDVKDVRLFEQGQIFTATIPADGTFISGVHESPQLSLGLTGNITTADRYTAQSPHFFELKGAIESVISLFTPPGGSSALTFTAEAPAWLQPGRSATALVNNEPIAHLRRTRLHRSVAAQAPPTRLPRAARPREALRSPSQKDHRPRPLPLPGRRARLLLRLPRRHPMAHHRLCDPRPRHPRAAKLQTRRSLAQRKIPRRLLPPHPHRLPIPRPHPPRRRAHAMVNPDHRHPHWPRRRNPRSRQH